MKFSGENHPLDAFILTFKDNSEPVITTQQGNDGKYRIVPAQWLTDMAGNEVAYFGKDHKKRIEIAMQVGAFLKLKDNRNFQGRCSTLVRLRTTPKTILGKLCYPIGHIDNSIEEK